MLVNSYFFNGLSHSFLLQPAARIFTIQEKGFFVNKNAWFCFLPFFLDLLLSLVYKEGMDPDFSDGKYLSFLATVDEGGKPHVRPVIGILAERKIYFSTKAGTKKAREMALNPPVELLVPEQSANGLGYVRFSGEAFRIFEEALIRATLAHSAYSPKRYIHMGENETICMYELIPIKVYQYLPDEKRERDITKHFLATEDQ